MGQEVRLSSVERKAMPVDICFVICGKRLLDAVSAASWTAVVGGDSRNRE